MLGRLIDIMIGFGSYLSIYLIFFRLSIASAEEITWEKLFSSFPMPLTWCSRGSRYSVWVDVDVDVCSNSIIDSLVYSFNFRKYQRSQWMKADVSRTFASSRYLLVLYVRYILSCNELTY